MAVGVLNTYVLSDLFIDITRAVQTTELTDYERQILECIMSGCNDSAVARLTETHRSTVLRHFAKACNKLAKTLGEEYYTELTEA